MADLKDARGKPVLVGEGLWPRYSQTESCGRCGVITGRITDADGRPVIQHQVNILRRYCVDAQIATLAKLRQPEAATARGKLRRTAETKKSEIELKPCQNRSDYQLKQ